jgi:hypothetical protein
MKEFILDTLRQLFGTQKPRSGKFILTRNAVSRMHEHQLDEKTLEDVFHHGEEVKENMIVRKYANYSVGIIAKLGERENQYVITTCWKRENW